MSLLPYSEGVLELAKMAVAEGVQGQGVGGKLMAATIAKARELGAKALYLESKPQLEAAISLYERAGFRHLEKNGRPISPYARANVFMRLDLASPA